MRALIDTRVFLWLAAEPEKLSQRARDVCSSETLMLSVASVWEIGIKHHIGRLPLPETPRVYLERQIRTAGVSLLPIHYRHALTAAALPVHHKDPFDRMLAAQCIEEKIPCVSRDPSLADYGIELIW
jgi:PIN domain nuclease of toxin-antitoxin system